MELWDEDSQYIRAMARCNERDHNCECGQLETVKHILKECPLHSAEQEVLRKVAPDLDPKIPLGTKKGLGAVVKFLDVGDLRKRKNEVQEDSRYRLLD